MTRSYKQWAIPLSQGDMSLGEALDDLSQLGAKAAEIPLIIQLMENPKYRMPGLTLFHGAIDLYGHDCVHILLGRGLLPKDEAFVIGYTMGRSHRVGRTEARLFGWIAQHIYPGVYRFGPEEVQIFNDAVALGSIGQGPDLHTQNFRQQTQLSLRQLRQQLQIDEDLLRAYYRLEQKNHPQDRASQRLLATAKHSAPAAALEPNASAP